MDKYFPYSGKHPLPTNPKMSWFLDANHFAAEMIELYPHMDIALALEIVRFNLNRGVGREDVLNIDAYTNEFGECL